MNDDEGLSCGSDVLLYLSTTIILAYTYFY